MSPRLARVSASSSITRTCTGEKSLIDKHLSVRTTTITPHGLRQYAVTHRWCQPLDVIILIALEGGNCNETWLDTAGGITLRSLCDLPAMVRSTAMKALQ